MYSCHKLKQMNKNQILEFLETHSQKVESADFDIQTWKETLAVFLENALGIGNVHTRQVRQLEPEFEISYEELYPQKIVDVEKTAAKCNKVINSIMAQVEIMDEKSLSASSEMAGKRTLELLVETLENNLNGKQIKVLKEVGSKRNGAKKSEQMLETIKQHDVDTMQMVLAEILCSKEIWDRVGK